MSDCCELTIDTTVDEISIDDPGVPGIGIPPGGLTDQVLVKKSNGNYDTEWKDSSANPSFAIITGSPYDNINLAAALNSIQSDIPTLISQLTNDVGFITASALTPYLTIATAASTYATQSSVTTALALKANLASPTFTGIVTLPAGQIVNGVTLQTGGSTTLFLNQNGVYSAAGTGSVTAVSIVSANGFAGSSSGGATPALTISTSITGILKGNGTAISAATAGTDYLAPFGSQTANFFYAAPNGSAGVPTFRAIIAADIPTLNQSTTGSAATLTTARNIAITGDMAWNVNFNGSANVTAAGTLATVNTTTGAFGSATQVATFTVNGKGLVTISGATTIQIAESQVTNLVSDLALKAPLASPTFTGIVTLPAGQVVNGVTLLTTGGTSVFLRGDGTYAAASGGGGGTVTSIDVSGGTTGLTTSGGPVTGSGTITLSGTLSIANGGTGQITQQLAINALAGAVTSGLFLRGNGTNVVLAAIQAADVPTLNQNTTGSAATWTTARNLAGNSVNGSADVAFANKFIVQGTADAGLTGAQFMGALATGITKNTTTTGVQTIAVAGTDYSAGTSALATGILKSTTTTGALTIAVAADFPTLNQSTTGSAATLTTTRAFSIAGTTGLTATGVNFNGSAAVALTLTGTLVIANGGTNITTYTLGDTLYSSATNTLAKLAGNTSATKQFYSQTGTGAVSAAPAWGVLISGDIPNNAANTTGSAGSFTGSLIGDVTGTQGATVVGKINGVSLAGLATGILKNTTTTGVLSIAVAADFPTLNQNTTGSSGSSSALISATTTVSVSAATAPTSGQVLTATSGTAATWQTPTGGGMAIGGAITGATSGSVLYVDGSLNLAQSNSNFYIDPTTHNIGLGTASPNATNLIDMVSTTKSFGLPSMSDTQRNAISSPRVGSVVYDNAFGMPYFYGVSNSITSWYQIYIPHFSGDFFTPASIDFKEAGTNGSNKITLTAPAALAADAIITLPSITGTIATLANTETFTNKIINANANTIIDLGGATTANFTVTSNTTLAIVTGTSNNVVSGGVYAFTAILNTTSSGTAGGIKVQMGGSATATNYNATVFAYTLAAVAVTASTSYGTPDFSNATVSADKLVISGTITVNAAGTFGIQFAQNTSNATSSVVLAGATLMLNRIS